MPQLGIMSTEFERSDLAAVLDAIVAHRIDAVQLHIGSALPEIPLLTALYEGLHVVGPHLTPALCVEIREQIAARGLTLAAVDGTCNMAHGDKARREDGLKQLRRLVESCDALGTDMVTLCTGSRDDIMWHRHPGNDTPEAWADLVATTKEAAVFAEANGVILAFEPELDNVVSSMPRARRLVDDVGSASVKILIDPANIFEDGELPQMAEKLDEAFSLAGDDIGFAHAKDLDHGGEPGHQAAGQGVLDYARYLSLLQASGYERPIVLHQLRHLPEAEIDPCLDFVREQAPAGYIS